jgi:protein-tyrosine-phosphatase
MVTGPPLSFLFYITAQCLTMALRVLQDEGFDASRKTSKSAEEFVNQSFDYVITL